MVARHHVDGCRWVQGLEFPGHRFMVDPFSILCEVSADQDEIGRLLPGAGGGGIQDFTAERQHFPVFPDVSGKIRSGCSQIRVIVVQVCEHDKTGRRIGGLLCPNLPDPGIFFIFERHRLRSAGAAVGAEKTGDQQDR